MAIYFKTQSGVLNITLLDANDNLDFYIRARAELAASKPLYGSMEYLGLLFCFVHCVTAKKEKAGAQNIPQPPDYLRLHFLQTKGGDNMTFHSLKLTVGSWAFLPILICCGRFSENNVSMG